MPTPQQRNLLILPSAASALSGDWWLGNLTIPLANVKEYVENPTTGHLYAGGTMSGAWSISFVTTLASIPVSTQYAFDSATGRVLTGVDIGNANGIYTGSWADITLYATGKHSYMLISDGSSLQAYRDNAAIGSPITTSNDIGGNTRWRSHNTTSATAPWVAALRTAHAANIALDSTQRDGLHAMMMALA